MPLFLIFQYVSTHSAFVLDVEDTNKKISLRTTNGFVKNFEGIESVQTGDLLWNKTSRYRIPIISRLLGLRQERAAMMVAATGGRINTTPAFILAVRDYIPSRINDQFTITGLAHLLSMSGFHVAVLTGGLLLFFSFLPKKLRLIPCIIVLPLLIPLSGFAVTVQRSVLFPLAYMFAYLLDLKVSSVKLLAFLAGSLILISPNNLYSISFLLSFSAVLGILIVFNKRYSLVKGIIAMGIASSVFTLPLQLYYFGTANLLSIITTTIFTPIVWLQMALGLLALIMPAITAPALVYTERFANWLINWLTDISWHTLFISKPPLPLLVIATAIALILVCTRFRLASLAIFILPMLPIQPDNVLRFPVLPPSAKGYILKTDNATEIFYQGMRSSFVYDMLPIAAEFGLKTFDYGRIRIFDGENLYLRVRNNYLSGLVCVNELANGCKYMYSTRSNTLTPPLDKDIKLYVIYNNKHRDDKIYIQKEDGELTIPLK
ncbi:hypothetical protein AGMMS49941_06200 [Deferribacterales bacterium]|nr:hypothetical protein AGMMS49941_06200 [Deferribacterales bacterium]